VSREETFKSRRNGSLTTSTATIFGQVLFWLLWIPHVCAQQWSPPTLLPRPYPPAHALFVARIRGKLIVRFEWISGFSSVCSAITFALLFNNCWRAPAPEPRTIPLAGCNFHLLLLPWTPAEPDPKQS